MTDVILSSIPAERYLEEEVSKLYQYCHVLAWLLRRVLDWMFRFIDTLYTALETTDNTALSLWSTQITVHRCIRTRVFSRHYSYRGHGFLTVSLSLQITDEVFLSQPNSFLATILQLPIPKRRLSSNSLLANLHPGRLASRNSTLFCAAEHYFIPTLYGSRRKHSLCC
jgi:hypothetical protein